MFVVEFATSEVMYSSLPTVKPSSGRLPATLSVNLPDPMNPSNQTDPRASAPADVDE
jgi:hypothetical protein